MSNLNNIVANKELCSKLVNLGILEEANLWHNRMAVDKDNMTEWAVEYLEDPLVHPDHCVPAWTKQELDVMIGNDWEKPDLYTQQEYGVQSKGRASQLERYPIFMSGKMFEFKNGADASATVLIMLIEAGKVHPENAMERYFKLFKD